jgi:diguanylate cyclase (GGDEF)-like protein
MRMQDNQLLFMLNAIGTASTVLLALSAYQIPAPIRQAQQRSLRYLRLALIGWALAFAIGSLQLFSAAWPLLRPLAIWLANLIYCTSYFCILVAVANRYQQRQFGLRSWQYAALLLVCSTLALALLDNFLLRNLLIPGLCALLLSLTLFLSYPGNNNQPPRQDHRGDRYLRLCLLLLLLNLLLTNLLLVPLTPPGIATSTRLLLFVLLNAILLSSLMTSIFHYDLSEQILHDSQTDALTGVYNRKILPTLQPQPNDCLLLTDLDHFKRINDTYGHDAGDYVLQQFAAMLQQALGPTDAVIRLGGEEFLLLLRTTELSAARQLAERLCQQVAATPLQFQGTPLQITASFGLCPIGAQPLTAAIQRADQLLYQAKAHGRNRLVSA